MVTMPKRATNRAAAAAAAAAASSSTAAPTRAAAAATRAPAPQVDFLILSIMSAVVPMIEAKCGEMNTRDRNTLKRRIEKAVRSFVAGGAK